MAQSTKVLAVVNANWNEDDHRWNVYANRFDYTNVWNAENGISLGN